MILAASAGDAGAYYAQAVNERNGENKTGPPVHLSVTREFPPPWSFRSGKTGFREPPARGPLALREVSCRCRRRFDTDRGPCCLWRDGLTLRAHLIVLNARACLFGESKSILASGHCSRGLSNSKTPLTYRN